MAAQREKRRSTPRGGRPARRAGRPKAAARGGRLRGLPAPGRERAALRPVSGAAVLAALAVLPVIAGCGTGESSGETGASTKPEPKPGTVSAAPASVERIAAMTGCEVDIRTEADQLRDGLCSTSLGDYLITTFPQEKFKRIWLDSTYGGKYLVGPRWAIGAEPKVLEQLRRKVGGEIQEPHSTSGPRPSTGPR